MRWAVTSGSLGGQWNDPKEKAYQGLLSQCLMKFTMSATIVKSSTLKKISVIINSATDECKRKHQFPKSQSGI